MSIGLVLLRPAQVTLGSLVLAAKSDATAFRRLPPGAYGELATITAEIEATLSAEIGYERINYLMLMMVDPNVHFHIFPRYAGSAEWEGVDCWRTRAGPAADLNRSAVALRRSKRLRNLLTKFG